MRRLRIGIVHKLINFFHINLELLLMSCTQRVKGSHILIPFVDFILTFFHELVFTAQRGKGNRDLKKLLEVKAILS